jgi:MFS family permease
LIEDKKTKYYYGYVIVVAGFIISALILGTYRTYGIFFTPLIAEFGWTSAVTSGAYSATYLLYGFIAILAGRMTDRFGPRVVLVTCGLLLGSGYILMSRVDSVWQLYLFMGLIVGAGNSGSDVPLLSTVARWFVRRRGTFTGITKAGVGVGMIAIPLLADWLISNHGWRNAYVVIGVIGMVGIVAAALFLKRDPAEVGQLPDGDTDKTEVKATADVRHFSLREALGMKQFWMFSAAWFSLNFCAQVIMLHIAPHIIEQGISATIAATIIGTIGGVSIVGRIGMGGLSDRIGSKATFIVAIAFLSVALVLIQFAQETWVFFLFAALYGIAHGAFFTLVSVTVAQIFGLASLGSIFGVVAFTGTVGGAIGPVISGRLFDITNNYQPGFLLCLGLSIIAIVLMSLLKPGQ